MEQATPTPAAEIKKASRRIVTLPSGVVVEIRRVQAHIIAAARGTIPDVTASSRSDEVAERMARDPAKLEAGIAASARIIVAGTVSPSFAEGNPDGLSVSDLALDDQGALLTAILEHSGWTKGAAEEAGPLSGTSA